MNSLEVIFAIMLSVISVVLGWYGREYLDDRIQRKRRSRLSNKQKMVQEYAAEWLVDYYIKKGEGDSLFTLPNGKKIPYLSRPEWQAFDASGLLLKYTIDKEQSEVSIDKSVIREREIMGQRLWDGPVLCLGGIVPNGPQFEIVLKRCSYFQYATIASHLEDEIFRSLRNTHCKTELRDNMASSIFQLKSGMLNAQILGFTTAVVIDSNGEKRVLIQARSDETGIAQGKFAVIPSFVCNASRYDNSCLPLDRHFFLLEFLEELYNMEELEQNDSYVQPNWFYKQPPADKILPILQAQGADDRFRVLGFGFDLHTGELHVATCFLIRESDLSKAEMQRMRYNYEVKGVESVPIASDRLRQLIISKRTYVTSAFTLSCLRRSVVGGYG